MQPPDAPIFAKTREGFDLPVIDLTNPRFAVPEDPPKARELYQAFVDGERRRRRVPGFIMRFMLRSAAKQSRLVRAMFSSQTGYLDGLSTYVMKLGPDNLVPPYDTKMDHRFASSPHVALVRLRMHQIARLAAEALAEEVGSAPATAPLSLINIGGGPALDSINTLIFLAHDRPDLLDRPISIDVLDASADGAFFGANALTALQAEGRPLAGLSITMQHHTYDWDETSLLERLLAEQKSAGAIIAATSEGALLEYGGDNAILANLRTLHGGARFVVGSVTNSDETRRRTIAQTRLHLVLRGLDGFAPLAAQAGFRIAKSESALMSDQALLRPV